MSEADKTMKIVDQLLGVTKAIYNSKNIDKEAPAFVELGQSLVKILRQKAEISELRATKIDLLEAKIRILELKDKSEEKTDYSKHSNSMVAISKDYKEKEN